MMMMMMMMCGGFNYIINSIIYFVITDNTISHPSLTFIITTITITVITVINII